MKVRRLLSCIIALTMILCIIPTYAAEDTVCVFDLNGFCDTCGAYEPALPVSDTHYPELNATHSGYYAIENAGQLYWFAEQVNAGNTSYNALLTTDITINEEVTSDSRAWTPIGDKTLIYSGTFDGRGFEISGLYHYSRTSYIGLFGHIGATAIVKNLGMVGGKLTGYEYIGAIAGYSEEGSLVTDCYSSGMDVYALSSTVGGIVGYSYGTVTKCYNESEVHGAYDKIGGIVGYNKGLISNCYNTARIAGQSYVGGVVGCNGNRMESCFHTGITYDPYNPYGCNIGYSYGSGATTENCFYLYTEEWDVNSGTTFKTEAQFASGEVAYLLNGSTSEGELIWGQQIGVDAHPVLYGMTVYKVTCGDYVFYSNSNTSYDGHIYDDCLDTDCNNCGAVRKAPGHSFTNGFCDTCGAYEPALPVSDTHYPELNATHSGYYAIENAGQLYWFAEQVNAGNTSYNALLTTDITINQEVTSDSRAWTPIGDKTLIYSGTFDGRGFEISGLYHYSRTSYIGLFGHIGATAIVKNLGMVGGKLTGYEYIGAIAGYSEEGSLVTDCYSSGMDVYALSSTVGGIVGYSYGTVTKCYNESTVHGAYDKIGGIVGYNKGLISNCYNTARIAGQSYVGGVVGCNGNRMENCFHTGITYDSYNPYGCNIGYSYGSNATTENCFYLYTEEWDASSGTTFKTEAQFASGEVAYLLGDAFGQNIDNGKTPDTHPVFLTGDNKVFPAGDNTYSNRISVGGGTEGGGIVVTPSVSLTQSSVTANGIGSSCLLVVARYTGDKFVTSSVSEISGDTTYELSSLLQYSKGDTVKAFLLSCDSKPLCESKSITITE